MSSANIFWSLNQTSALRVAVASQFVTRVLKTSSEESFTIAVPVAAAVLSSSRSVATRLLSNRARSYLSAQGQRSPAVKPISVDPKVPEEVEPDQSDPLASGAAAASSARPTPRSERVQLIIDSLQNYDLLKPIPVVVDSLADKIFTAEAPDLNLSISENSLGGALLLLKDRIATIYEEYRMKKTLDPGQARRLEILQTYFGKAKRNWR